MTAMTEMIIAKIKNMNNPNDPTKAEKPIPDYLLNNLILMTVTGDRAYGVAKRDSDWYVQGVVVLPIDYYFGLKTFEGFKTKIHNIHINITDIHTFVKRCIDGDIHALEMLFLRESDYLKKTKAGQMLIDNRKQFISKETVHKIDEYQNLVMSRMDLHKQHPPKIGYVTEQFMHVVRLYDVLFEIIDYGEFNTYRSNNRFLRKIRDEDFYTRDDVIDYINDKQQIMKAKLKTTDLTESIDKNLINTLLININKVKPSMK